MLAKAEKEIKAKIVQVTMPMTILIPLQNPIATKPTGFKKIFSKMRRANSGPIPQELKKEFDTDKEQCRASAGSQLALGWELQKGLAHFESDVIQGLGF